jgi:hypothetical protein
MPTKEAYGQYLIPKETPADWKPEEIVYARWTFDLADGRLVFAGDPQTCVYPATSEAELDAFCRRLAKGDVPPCVNPGNVVKKPGMGTPLDIQPTKQGWVVIELDPSRNWHFRTDGVALTTKADYGNANAQLVHIGPDGEPLPGPPQTEDCRIIHFRVVTRDPGAAQSFNAYVGIDQADYPPLPVLIDPNIPTDSGGIP